MSARSIRQPVRSCRRFDGQLETEALHYFAFFSKLFCSLGKVRWGPGGRLSVLIVSCVNFSEWCALSYTVPPNRAHSRPRLSTSTKSLYSLRLFKGSPDICFNCSQCFVIFSRNLPMGCEGEQWSKMWVISNTFVGEILLIEECFWYAFDYNLKRKKKRNWGCQNQCANKFFGGWFRHLHSARPIVWEIRRPCSRNDVDGKQQWIKRTLPGVLSMSAHPSVITLTSGSLHIALTHSVNFGCRLTVIKTDVNVLVSSSAVELP